MQFFPWIPKIDLQINKQDPNALLFVWNLLKKPLNDASYVHKYWFKTTQFTVNNSCNIVIFKVTYLKENFQLIKETLYTTPPPQKKIFPEVSLLNMTNTVRSIALVYLFI